MESAHSTCPVTKSTHSMGRRIDAPVHVSSCFRRSRLCLARISAANCDCMRSYYGYALHANGMGGFWAYHAYDANGRILSIPCIRCEWADSGHTLHTMRMGGFLAYLAYNANGRILGIPCIRCEWADSGHTLHTMRMGGFWACLAYEWNVSLNPPIP